MATLFTPTTEFLDVVDGLEAVTLVPRTGEPTTIAHAKRRAVSLREAAASNGKYTQADATWHVHYTELATPPRLGDRIQDSAGDYWTILEVGRETRNTRWRCVSRDLAIVAGLNTQVTIERVAFAPDRHGAMLPTWTAFAVVQARIQTETASGEVEHDAKVQRGRYRITLAEPLAIVVDKMRVVDNRGDVYKIESYSDAEEIDVLPSLTAVRTPWPLN